MPPVIAELPELASPCPVNDSRAEAYRRDGHVLLRGIVTEEELAPFRAGIRDAVLRLNRQTTPLAERDTYHKAFIQVANLWEHDDVARRFAMARRFAGIAADLMGVDGVRLYHDQALFKEAGGGHTPWHQDQFYWPLDTVHCITMWMPLVDASEEMGTLIFASGSQREGYLGDLPISDASHEVFDAFVREHGYARVQTPAMSAGDATFHGGWTLHSAPPNGTGRSREVMTVIYYADGARIREPRNKNQVADLERWFPGQKPGEIAASELNPLLFRRRGD